MGGTGPEERPRVEASGDGGVDLGRPRDRRHDHERAERRARRGDDQRRARHELARKAREAHDVGRERDREEPPGPGRRKREEIAESGRHERPPVRREREARDVAARPAGRRGVDRDPVRRSAQDRHAVGVERVLMEPVDAQEIDLAADRGRQCRDVVAGPVAPERGPRRREAREAELEAAESRPRRRVEDLDGGRRERHELARWRRIPSCPRRSPAGGRCPTASRAASGRPGCSPRSGSSRSRGRWSGGPRRARRSTRRRRTPRSCPGT